MQTKECRTGGEVGGWRCTFCSSQLPRTEPFCSSSVKLVERPMLPSFFIVGFGRLLIGTLPMPFDIDEKKKKNAQATRGNWHRASGGVVRTNRSNYKLQEHDGWVGHGLTADLKHLLPHLLSSVHSKLHTALTSYLQ